MKQTNRRTSRKVTSSRSRSMLFSRANNSLFLCLYLLLSQVIFVQAQVELWGMTQGGGTDRIGTIFNYDINTMTHTVRHEMDNLAPGRSPVGNLVESGGKLYGTSSSGGLTNDGILFSYDTLSGSYTKLYEFDPNNGNVPYGSLVDVGGILYGMTYSGGANNGGVIFSYDPSGGGYTKHLDFNRTNGRLPFGSLVESGGMLYGMTISGGSSDFGALFSYDTSGVGFANLHDFDGTNGRSPFGSLIVVNSSEICLSNLTGPNALTGVQNTSAEYQSAGTISSTQMISGAGVMVDYNSGTDINLNANFEVVPGAEFRAFIDVCGGR